ncbi:LacI family transcriptional regulator [Roseomonas sp. OT10]|uniref:LacI family DNA-binding transcriptional regulator n=1 Tax=Roseomonas cutis TaxID=2897332 RepID=UPI001E53B359|nr:LacI family DNA-binding transcriptional regulator [Roseomonas sp. OT10]UFN47718.1 LacI family transcriptional regulator [Roseomonas sp. OT10]
MTRTPPAPPQQDARPAGETARGTLRDVARAAGVSMMTVSNVLRGRAGAAEDTRARVLACAEALGYRPHASARRLRTATHGTIGLLIVDQQPDFLRDPFTSNLAAGLGNVASAQGLSLLVQGARPAALGRQAPLLARVETDALCVLLSGSAAARAAALEAVAALRQPVVLLQETQGGLPDCCLVRQDDQGGGVLLGEHLRPRLPEAPRVLVLRPDAEWDAQSQRAAGLAQGLGRKARLAILRCGNEGWEDTREAVGRWLDRHGVPDAVVGGNDQMALAAMRLLRDRGVEVPGRTRVAGFNGFSVFRYAEPSLTTIVSPAYEVGMRAGEAVLARLAGAFPAAEIVLPVTLRPGESA